MKSHEIADCLSDIVRATPDHSQIRREELAEYIATLESRIEQLERALSITSNTASRLANGIVPD